MQQIVVLPWGVTVPVGWPPSGMQDPPVGAVVTCTLATPAMGMQAPGERLVMAVVPWQVPLLPVVTLPLELQSIPDGALQVHGGQLRLSLKAP
ncbi:MAG: hypothetical protein ACREOE_14760 [Gemmatimonadales bacterium]